MFKQFFNRRKSKSKSKTTKNEEVKTNAEEVSKADRDELNAKVLDRYDFELITKRAAINESIYNPYTFILSYKSNNADDVEKTSITEHMAIIRAQTHKYMKEYLSIKIKQLKESGKLDKYDGLIVVPLCIVQIQEQDEKQIYKFHFDGTNERRHVQRLEKDIKYRLDTDTKLHIDWEFSIINNIDTNNKQRISMAQRVHSKQYDTTELQIKQLKIEVEWHRINDALLTIIGFWRKENQNILRLRDDREIFRVMFIYYFGSSKLIDQKDVITRAMLDCDRTMQYTHYPVFEPQQAAQHAEKQQTVAALLSGMLESLRPADYTSIKYETAKSEDRLGVNPLHNVMAKSSSIGSYDDAMNSTEDEEEQEGEEYVEDEESEDFGLDITEDNGGGLPRGWTHRAEDGISYYHNESTGVTQWEHPDPDNRTQHINDVSEKHVSVETEEKYGDEHDAITYDRTQTTEEHEETQTVMYDGDILKGVTDDFGLDITEDNGDGGDNASGGLLMGWTEHRTEDGKAYYHNESTGVTQWEHPDNRTQRINNAVSEKHVSVETQKTNADEDDAITYDRTQTTEDVFDHEEPQTVVEDGDNKEDFKVDKEEIDLCTTTINDEKESFLQMKQQLTEQISFTEVIDSVYDSDDVENTVDDNDLFEIISRLEQFVNQQKKIIQLEEVQMAALKYNNVDAMVSPLKNGNYRVKTCPKRNGSNDNTHKKTGTGDKKTKDDKNHKSTQRFEHNSNGNDDDDDEENDESKEDLETKYIETPCNRDECIRNRWTINEQNKLMQSILDSKKMALLQIGQLITEKKQSVFGDNHGTKTKRKKCRKKKKKICSDLYIDYNDVNKYNTQISKQFKFDLSSMIRENIKTEDIYPYMDKWTMISKHGKDIQKMAINYDFHDKNGKNMYFIIHKQDPKVNRGYEFKMDEKVYTEKQLQAQNMVIPRSLRDKSFKLQLQHENSLQRLMKTGNVLQELVKNTKWSKLHVFNDLDNNKRITLSMDKGEFIRRCIKSIDITRCRIYDNDYDLIPIMMFDDECKRWMVQFVWIIKILSEQNIDIGISLKYTEKKGKTSIKMTGIHLIKSDIYKRHMLVSPHHMNECKHLDNLFVYSINDIKIGYPNADAEKIKQYEEQNEQLKGLNNTLMELYTLGYQVNLCRVSNYSLQMPQTVNLKQLKTMNVQYNTNNYCSIVMNAQSTNNKC